MLKDIAELKAMGFTETDDLPVLVVPAAEKEVRSNPRLAWHPRSEEESFERAYAVGAAYIEAPAERYVDIPKLGLNPVNKYNTPTGLYWYPFDKTSEFATDRPYRITANLVGMGVDLSKVSDEHIEEMRELLVDVFPVYFSLEDVWERSRRFIETDYNSNRKRTAQEKRAALWWSVTRYCAEKIGRYQRRKVEDAWTSVFRSLGIDFVFDPGFGVVHRSEPHQIVSFSNNVNVLKDVAIEENAAHGEDSEWDRGPWKKDEYKLFARNEKGALITKNYKKRLFQKQSFYAGDTLVLGEFYDEEEEVYRDISFSVVRFLPRKIVVLFEENLFVIHANAWSTFEAWRESGRTNLFQRSTDEEVPFLPVEPLDPEARLEFFRELYRNDSEALSYYYPAKTNRVIEDLDAEYLLYDKIAFAKEYPDLRLFFADLGLDY